MIERRAVLGALLVGGAVAACSPASSALTTAGTSAGRSAPSVATQSATPPAVPAAPVPTLPPTHAWTARAGEVRPSVKAQATQLLEAVAAWSGEGGGSVASARKRATAAGFDPTLADALTALLGSGTHAVAQVRDAQYGGILDSTASVLVVVDQWRALADGSLTAGGTTVDVRLVANSPHWKVVEVHPAQPGPAAASLSAEARAVLASARLHLPHAAHADVAAGRIHDSVLTFALELAQRHIVDVSVMRSGHPLLVFGTDRPSDHPRGRAVDVWALDGKPLVVPSNHDLAVDAMEFATAQGAYNVGGPVLLDGAGYFSDDTHQDHIHVGFNY